MLRQVLLDGQQEVRAACTARVLPEQFQRSKVGFCATSGERVFDGIDSRGPAATAFFFRHESNHTRLHRSRQQPSAVYYGKSG